MRQPLLKLFTLLAIVSSSLVSAQTFVPGFNSVNVTYPGFGIIESYNTITVLGPASVDITWRVIDEDFSDDPTWILHPDNIVVCDLNMCFINANQLILNGTPFMATYPGDTTEAFNVKFNLEGANPGTHYVTFLLSDFGSSFDTTITYNVSKSANNVVTVTNGKEDIVLFPNPAQGEVNVLFNDLNIKNIDVYNVIGKNMIVYRTSGTSAKLDISKFPSGVYFLRMSDAKGDIVATKRITKQ